MVYAAGWHRPPPDGAGLQATAARRFQHEVLHGERYTGEWFKLNDEDLEILRTKFQFISD